MLADQGVDVELDASWGINGNPHGGYLLRLMAEAALDDNHPHPLAVSAHFLTPPAPGRASVVPERLRSGRRVATTRCRLIGSNGEQCAEALVSAGHLAAASTPHFARPPLAPIPAPEGLVRSPAEPPGSPFRVGHLDHVDLRLDPETLGWASGKPARQAEYRGWIRRADGADATLLDLLVFADALPPTTFDLGISGWVPTLELTVLLRAMPAPGWILVRQRSALVADGWLDEDCDLWDSTGQLVAQARQLAGYRVG